MQPESCVSNQSQGYVIYALVDPRTGEPRYVGCTRNGVERRRRQHMGEAGASGRKARWLSELLSLGLEPAAEALEILPLNPNDAGVAEASWFRMLRGRGCDLLNAYSPSVLTEKSSAVASRADEERRGR